MVGKGGARVKGGSARPSAGLRLVNGALLVGFGVVSSILLAPAVKTWWIILREPVVWAPDPPPLLAVAGPASVLAAALWLALSRSLSGRPTPRGVAAVVIVGSGIVILVSIFPGRTGTLVLSPAARVGTALDALVKAAADARSEAGEYPAEADVLMASIAEMETGYRARFRKVPFTVVAEIGVGPRLQAREGDLPGTFYYTVAPDRRRYWLTGMILDGVPTGRLVFVEGSEGPMVVSRGPVDAAHLE